MTAQERLQVLMQDKARDDVPGMAQHQREQPDDARHARLVFEGDDEAGEVDLSLVACRRLEANLKGLGSLARPDGRNEALHGRVSTEIAALAQLARQPDGAEIGESRDALAKIVEVGCELVGPTDLTRPVDGQLEAARDVFADRLRITPRTSRNRRDRQALAVKVQNHHEFSQLDHRRRPHPNLVGGYGRRSGKALGSGGAPRNPGQGRQPGNFRCPQSGSIQRPMTIITGGGKWVEISINADPLYQHLLLTAEKRFWRCVQTGEEPRPFGVEPPRPRIEAVRTVDMSVSNAWAEFAAVYCRTRSGFVEHEKAKGELKALMPEDAKEAYGHGVRAKRSKSGAISFDLMVVEGGHAAL